MKKSIKAELVSLAHKILQLRDTADYSHMAEKARDLHEKLTILSYAEKMENTGRPTIGTRDIEQEMKFSLQSERELSKPPQEILLENREHHTKVKATTDDDYHRPDGTQFSEEEPVHEPVIEKIKDMWPEMNPEAADMDKVIDAIIPQTPSIGKNDSFEIGNEYGQTPIFEPKATTTEEVDDRPKNLNDILKSGKLKIGLNDKLSFIKHLFNGSAKDYNRVLSQLETLGSAAETQQFISQMVKPDYNNWEGKEVQEQRFMEIIEGRYS